ncbi:Derlin-1.2 [Lachnellula suecica]|uniref:Derlin n=1 Tax=Lachnellula suecica TaxID=602035 RepID=A0A8T9C5T6_9HELO|nr:Derlin-1.2 [Lachnellula suecica]
MWLTETFFSAPPITRTLAALVFLLSALVYTTILPYRLFNLSYLHLFQLPPEIWRIFTSLLITFPNLGVFFDTYFFYTYGAKLESASPRFSQRADYVTYICFVCLVILLLNLCIVSGQVFASAIAVSFITTWTREAWGQPIILVFVRIPAQYLPYGLLLSTLILWSPEAAMIEATGLVAAHLYDLLTGLYPASGIKRNFITTPGWVNKMFGTQHVVERPYGTVWMPRVAGETAWGLDMSWKRFGPGRTLGGEGASVERQRPKGLILAAMVMGGFLVLCCIVGLLFLRYGDPSGWFSNVPLSSGSEEVGVQ